MQCFSFAPGTHIKILSLVWNQVAICPHSVPLLACATSFSFSWQWHYPHRDAEDPYKDVVWRRFFKSPLDCKEIKPVNRKGNQS